MGWELLALQFGFRALDYGLSVIARDPQRANEARPLIARVQVMLAEQRGPNADDYAALDAMHDALDVEIDQVIADDEAQAGGP
jgi:hypothetical protein